MILLVDGIDMSVYAISFIIYHCSSCDIIPEVAMSKSQKAKLKIVIYFCSNFFTMHADDFGLKLNFFNRNRERPVALFEIV